MTQEHRSATRAFAALPSGVHAIPMEQALKLLVSEEEKPLLWIDVTNPGADEAAFLRDEMHFHPLAVEDCLRGRQRPKLERYPGYFFLVVYAARVNPDRGRVALNELHVFLSERLLVTVHDSKVREITEIVARWRANQGHYSDVGSLAHALLDSVVDDYFPVLEHFSSRMHHLESTALGVAAEVDMQQALLLRRELVLLRRVVAPMRDLFSTLLRRDLPFLRPELLPYFQDVHDHTIRVTEEIDAQRELLSAALDAQLSAASNQLNRTMRTMTAWAIILMSMALVAGIYGMNFRAMPELEWRYGYYAALAAMALLGGALITFFRRRDWL